MKSVSQSGNSNPYASFSYYRNDAIRGISYEKGLVANYTYNKVGQASRITLNNTSTSPAKALMVLNYAYASRST